MRKVSLFWWTVLSLIVTYLLLKFGLSYLSMLIAGKEHPLPIPATAMIMFLILAFMAAAVYVTYSEENVRDFITPVVAFLRGPEASTPYFKFKKAVRGVVLAVIPLLVAGLVYDQAVPKVQSPTTLRIQHPTIPGAFEKLQNPFRTPSDDAVRAFMVEANLNLSLAEGRKLLIGKYIEEGVVLYQINCRPCHGTKAAGEGEMGRGFRLKPIDFTDPGTIATLVESYLFWRIKEGGPGLPPESTPWDSAMPIWREELKDEEIWKIIMAEYDTAGVEPRKPEKLE